MSTPVRDEEGVEAALAGKSTLEEILRVTSEDDISEPALPAPILAGADGTPASTSAVATTAAPVERRGAA